MVNKDFQMFCRCFIPHVATVLRQGSFIKLVLRISQAYVELFGISLSTSRHFLIASITNHHHQQQQQQQHSRVSKHCVSASLTEQRRHYTIHVSLSAGVPLNLSRSANGLHSTN